MAKDPAFLFYTGDFTTGTQFFTDEQLGKYLRLLMAQHQIGHLEEKHMLNICKSHDKDIFAKFIKDDKGLYYNKRLEDELVKRKSYSLSRSNNRKKKENLESYDNHMENEDISISNTVKQNSEKNGKQFVNFKAQGENLFADRDKKFRDKTGGI